MKGGLFPRLAFSPDESHLSWAGRLAAFHTKGGVEAFLRDMHIPTFAFFGGHAEFVQRLCYLADQDPEPLLRNTILRSSSYRFSLNDEVFSSDFLMGQMTKFCPKCLLEDDGNGERSDAQRRDRLLWRFRSVFVCPIHQIYLMSDGQPGDWKSDLSVRVPLSTSNLELLSNNSETVQPSPLESYLIGRMSGARGPDWLDGQTLEQAIRSTEMLGAVMEFGYRVNTDEMTIAQAQHAGSAGWEWTSRGEEGLRAAFQILQAATPREMTARDRHPGHAFGELYHWLAPETDHNDRGPTRDVLRQHIIETEPITTNLKILGVKVNRNGIKPQKQIPTRQT
ncbi:hypothetical protein EOK75_00560 [Pseudorhodobacter turbinis]|uniref:TniQ domain-containing protein n=1 Tax=Pseudorhodobacter turbinis TaxID=2500533 RepID=A0A4P8EC67_9RHOB|nr:TniQ family protein [Pseudorhodobacter turbinis]QCO54441.1 hypothetical protein EOK75_00560 [Pseudorhodobacter turbinis]